MNSKLGGINHSKRLSERANNMAPHFDARPVYDNKQEWVKVKCPVCKKAFITKKQGGYTKCRSCNNK